MTEQETDPQLAREGSGGTLEGHGDEHAGDAHHAGGGHDHEHGTGNGHTDEHSADMAEAPPGPIDWGAWLVSIVGLAAGGVIALVLAQTIAHG